MSLETQLLLSIILNFSACVPARGPAHNGPIGAMSENFQNPTAPAQLGQCQRHLACVFCESGDTIVEANFLISVHATHGTAHKLHRPISPILYTCTAVSICREQPCYAIFYIWEIKVNNFTPEIPSITSDKRDRSVSRFSKL